MNILSLSEYWFELRNISENSVKELCWRLVEASDSVIVIFTPAHVYKQNSQNLFTLFHFSEIIHDS